MVRTAVIALGSNLGDREAFIRAGLSGLAGLGQLRAVSSLYETPPVGPPQPDYLNAVALLETAIAPIPLMQSLLRIETRLGRERIQRWGPRCIDLDLVAMDDLVVDTPGLTLPHPQAHLRAFVLAPLDEIAPAFVLVGHGRASALLEALPAAERGGVRRLGC
jgi:2-amino-4-hydroxy-6-hydroxymethyldihydropteridine diphosphokinase